MAGRYAYTKTKQEKDTKKTHLETTIYPKVKPKNNDIYVISEAGDRLDLLAHKYYGDTKMWWIIATANNLNDANFFIEPGRQIRIPTDVSGIINDLSNINK